MLFFLLTREKSYSKMNAIFQKIPASPTLCINCEKVWHPIPMKGCDSIMFKRKITVIGAGSVGSATAYTLALKGIAGEVVLVDINEKKADGEALDIYHGTPLMDAPVDVYAGSYEDTRGSSIVVITSGLPRKADQTRLELTQTNVDILRDIAPKITAYCPDATYILVSNPVDILTYAFLKLSGLPDSRVIGTGTLLDTARLRSYISRAFDVSQKSVHAYVFGEHGDTSFIPWSINNISGIDPVYHSDLVMYKNGMETPKINCDEIENHIRTSGAEIIRRKGYTNYAISTAIHTLCEALYASNCSTMMVSAMLHGEYGLSNVCLSLPTLLGNGCVQGRIMPRLARDELEKLKRSGAALKSVIEKLAL